MLRTSAAGAVEVELTVGSLRDATSYNVIASPPGRACEPSRAATTTASRRRRAPATTRPARRPCSRLPPMLSRSGQMGGNCFVLFGAEELGSDRQPRLRRLARQRRPPRLKAMLNFDMVGVGDETWLLIGTRGAAAAAA